MLTQAALFLPAQTLKDILKARGTLTIPEVRCYMRQLFLGLKYIHEQGYIHRDITLGMCTCTHALLNIQLILAFHIALSVKFILNSAVNFATG